MNVAWLAGTMLVIAGCGALDPEEDGTMAESKELPKELTFSGFVQRAFTIKVNGVSFNDSEHFYTRFIPDLILSNKEYASLKDSSIEVDGEYGLEKFGGNTAVFMSSVGANGHLFQARTDDQGKFSVAVEPKALDETYKARLVIRIGLRITNPDKTTEKFCYLLFGNRDGIRVSDASKPVIFSDFKTQLNTYECSQVKEEGLVIPTKGGSTPAGGSTTAPTAKKDPYVKLSGGDFEVELPLAADEEGGSDIVSATPFLAGDGLLFVRSRVRNKTDGKEYYPVYEATKAGNGGWVAGTSKRLLDQNVSTLVKLTDSYLNVGAGYQPSMALLDSALRSVSNVGYASMGTVSSAVVCDVKSPKLYFAGNDYNLSYRPIDLLSDTILGKISAGSAPSEEMRSGRHISCAGQSLWGLDSSNYISTFNLNYVFQEKAVIPRLLLPKADLDRIKVLGIDGKPHLWLPSAKGVKVMPISIVKE